MSDSYIINRYFVNFDLSEVSNLENLQSITLTLTGRSSSNSNAKTIVVESTAFQDPSGDLIGDDFDQLSFITPYSNIKETWNTSGINSYVLNSTAINFAKTNEYLTLAVIEAEFDYLDIDISTEITRTKDVGINAIGVNSPKLILGFVSGDIENLVQDGGSENWSLEVNGEFKSGSNSDLTSQNSFLKETTFERQYIRYWDGEINDELGFFNLGNSLNPLQLPINSNAGYLLGTYNPKRTSNIPWEISCSMEYSASQISEFNQPITVDFSGLYSLGSTGNRLVGVNQQETIISSSLQTGSLFPTSQFVNDPTIKSSLDPELFNLNVDYKLKGGEGVGMPTGSFPQFKYDGVATGSISINRINWEWGGLPSLVFAQNQVKVMYTGSDATPAIVLATSSISPFIDMSVKTSTRTGANAILNFNFNFESGSMLYIQYDFFNFIVAGSGGTDPQPTSLKLQRVGDLDYPSIFFPISLPLGSGSTMEIPGEGGYNLTASIEVWRGNLDNINSIGSIIHSESFIIPDETSLGTLSSSFTFNDENVTTPYRHNDVFRLAVSTNKNASSGLSILNYSMSIYPSNFIYSPLDPPFEYGKYNEPTPNPALIESYFGEGVLPFNLALDCQPLLNNYIDNRESTFLMDVDYTNLSGSIIPVNQQQILNNTAAKAAVPDSNYTSLRSITPRYLGSKSTSKYINKWAVGDTGTFGKLPTIELRNAFFGYFDSIEDPYPNKNDVIKLNLNYLIDQQGNALPPSLEGISKDIFEKVFPISSDGTLSIESGSKALKKLNAPYPLVEVGSYPTPIMYSQTSSNGHTTSIPLSGSGRISRYDNDSTSGISHYTFEVIGTASINTSTPLQTFNYVIDPSEQLVPIGTDPAYDITNGVITYTSSFDQVGEDLSNFQQLSLQTSIPTTYIYDSSGVRDEMTLILSLVSGSTNIPFNFKDLQLRVHRTGDRVSDLGSVIGEGWLNFVSPGFVGQKQSTDTPRLNTNNQIQITVDKEMESFLRRKGVYRKGGDILFKNPELLSLEWILTADSGDYIFKGGDQIKWTLSGSMKKSRRGVPQAVFFPENHPKAVDTPSKISTIGALDHIFATDNTASAPYWVFGDQVGTSREANVLYMSSSNMNEAYGTEYKQGDLPYIPGPSPYFPGGVEPLGTQFDIIEFPLEIYPQDEIRFANNEDYSYIILEVEPPQNNIIGGVGRIKITLDRNVPGDVNKDFFLIRRNIPDASSIYMGTTFPYQTPPSASTSPGILFPEYPSLELETSASLIVTDLISKGVII